MQVPSSCFHRSRAKLAGISASELRDAGNQIFYIDGPTRVRYPPLTEFPF